MSSTQISAEHFNGELRKLGRQIDDATIVGHGWKGEEYTLEVTWPDGYSASIGLGPLATAAIESRLVRKH